MANQSFGFGVGMGSKLVLGSKASRSVSDNSSTEPIAWSLRAEFGGMKTIFLHALQSRGSRVGVRGRQRGIKAEEQIWWSGIMVGAGDL